MALRAGWHKSCMPSFAFCLINWNNKWRAVPSRKPLPGFLFQLLFKRSNFGLQSSNGSFEFVLHSSLHLLQLTLQLLVLPLQLLPSVFILLCSCTLCCQLVVQLLCLQGGEYGHCQERCMLSEKWQVTVLQIFIQNHKQLWLEYKQSTTGTEMCSTCCTAFLMRSPIASMLLCSSSSSSSSWAILASRRRFSSWRLVL